MKLPRWATTVTPLSKALAMLLFIALPFIGFWLGIQYQLHIGNNQLKNCLYVTGMCNALCKVNPVTHKTECATCPQQYMCHDIFGKLVPGNPAVDK